MKVVYEGDSDFQEFDAQDFAKAELEQDKLSFARGEPVEVPDAVGETLLSSEGVFGDVSFSEAEEDDDDPNQLKGQELTQALLDAGLSTSGKVAEKRARLQEYLDSQVE